MARGYYSAKGFKPRRQTGYSSYPKGNTRYGQRRPESRVRTTRMVPFYRAPSYGTRSTRSGGTTGSKSLVLKKTREFLWGTLTSGLIGAGGAYTAGTITYPDNTGGTVTASLAAAGGPLVYSQGFSWQFANVDTPVGFADFVGMFEQYKIDKVRSIRSCLHATDGITSHLCADCS